MNRMTMAAAAAAIAACLAGVAQVQAQGGTAGRWTQSSRGQELVLAPRIKLQPNVGNGYGTNLGGSVGAGSMTRTTIVTEPKPMEVARSMTLEIGADRRFSWTIVKRHGDGKCVKTTTQVKEGQVEAAPGKMVFAISGGSEKWQSSCGDSGVGKISPAREAYDATVQGATLRLSSGPSRWTFTRG